MKVGTAATVFEINGFSAAALDIMDKKRRTMENKRKELTVQKLESLIDFEHIIHVCALQWLRVLVNFVPSLRKYQKNVNQHY